LGEALDKLDANWEGSDLRKLSVNSMIGLWAAPRQYTYMTKTHEGLDDICFEGAKVRRGLAEFALEEVVLRFEQVSNTSMSTLHRQIIDAEALLLARVASYMRFTLTARCIKECRVDSVLFQGGRKAPELMKRVSALTYGDLHAPPEDNHFQKFIRHEHEAKSDTLAFRTYSIKPEDPVILRGSYKIPKMDVMPPQPCVDWTYFSEEAFKAICLNGGSGYISGIAGVGKSYTMLQITKALEEQGRWVKTHAASQNIGGQTCDSFLHKYGNGGFSSKNAAW